MSLKQTVGQVSQNGIKSIQRGVLSNSASVTISPVNMARTELRVCGTGGVYGGGSTANEYSAYASLTSPTTLGVQLPSNASNGATLSWELTEYF